MNLPHRHTLSTNCLPLPNPVIPFITIWLLLAHFDAPSWTEKLLVITFILYVIVYVYDFFTRKENSLGTIPE